eukprot:368465_1
MSSFYLSFGPILFALIFLGVWAIGYTMSRKLKLVRTKLPFFCQTGDQKPVYYVWVIGHSFSVLALVLVVVTQYLERKKCFTSSEWLIINIITLIFGLIIGISLFMIVIFDFRRCPNGHNCGVCCQVLSVYIYIILSNLLTIMVVCLDHKIFGIWFVIIIRYLILIYYFIVHSFTVYHMKNGMKYWKILRSKDSNNENVENIDDDDDINIDDVIAIIDDDILNTNDHECDETKKEMKYHFRRSAIWQYQSLIGLVVYILTLSFTQLL